MKIANIESIVVFSGRANWVFIRATSDSGLVGYGECSIEGHELAVQSEVGALSGYFIGKSASALKQHIVHVTRDNYWRFSAISRTALSGIELAIWDLIAKEAGKSVADLHGGRIRDFIPTYANGWFVGAKGPKEFAEYASRAVSRGFEALKWDPFGSAYKHLGKQAEIVAKENVRAVREAVGDNVDLIIEGHGRFDLTTAIRFARWLEEFDIFWLEEPLEPGAIGNLSELRRASNLTIAAGERTYSRHHVLELLTSQAVDVVQTDMIRCGGWLEMLAVSHLVDAFQKNLSPHNPNGPICNAATLQLASLAENITRVETLFVDVPWRAEVARETFEFSDGFIRMTDVVGWGVDIDWENAKQHPYEPYQVRQYNGALTDVLPKDSKTWLS